MKTVRAVNGGSQKLFLPFLHYFKERSDEIVQTIRQLVELESPSDVKQAVDRLGTILRGRFEELGGKVRIHPVAKFGNHLQVDFAGAQKSNPVLLLGHMDTVYPIGTISRMPCHEAKGLLSQGELARPVTVFLVSDEEVGSPSSRKITESLARKSSAVLVLEPAYGIKGALKTARKGVGEYTMKVTGKAAHSGLDFEKGESAILEMAKQIVAISRLVDLKRGLTLNVGQVSGGTRTNVIAAQATVSLDVRVA